MPMLLEAAQVEKKYVTTYYDGSHTVKRVCDEAAITKSVLILGSFSYFKDTIQDIFLIFQSDK
jgi:hypothetical protein